ncbi:MlaD family protein [[Mycobacterium] wendilense]|uniref:MlaD family protein n=1 Tax=[Mycobacterium] wendilense TaxID=3064284 RepID=A0ABN9P2N8_9MYCO|nr:MlaD family protein [Mycolicibacterium sp. MU0050]CAJ1581081.1 MlaD family protein [Mycolicibacterium sp. MU0050]
MHLTRRIRMQLTVFAVVSVVAGAVMIFGYINVPAMFGIGRYAVTVELPEAAGLYKGGNVTYRGTKVGRVDDVRLTDTGVEAVLSLNSGVDIPSDLRAEVHSQSAVGEQFVALLPRDGGSAPLKGDDVITRDNVTVPPDINELVDATNKGLQAIPRDNLKTAVDEGYVAFGGLGPDLARLVDGSTSLAIDARRDLDSLTTLIDESGPVLNSQVDSSDSIAAWARNVANLADQVKNHDSDVRKFLDRGAGAADQGRALFDRVNPTLPVLLANLVSVGEVALTYNAGIEQILVVLPASVASLQAAGIANRDTRQDYKGAYLDFNLNLNLPPPCNTGYLPVQQRRPAAHTDAPDLPEGDVYCRVPQDSQVLAVRGARNIPCLNAPGKRAPTAQLCESDEQYVPLNEGLNWKGDPNATLSGQAVPQLRPGQEAPASIPAPQYDPATGTYVGPDGKLYTQSNLARPVLGEQTWESMLVPPGR